MVGLKEIRIEDLVPYLVVNDLKMCEFLGVSKDGFRLPLRRVVEFGKDMVGLLNEHGDSAVLVVDSGDLERFVEAYSDVFGLVEEGRELFISLKDGVGVDDLRRDFLGYAIEGPGRDMTVEELNVWLDEIIRGVEEDEMGNLAAAE